MEELLKLKQECKDRYYYYPDIFSDLEGFWINIRLQLKLHKELNIPLLDRYKVIKFKNSLVGSRTSD